MCDDAHVSSANSPTDHFGVVEFWMDAVFPWCGVTARSVLTMPRPPTTTPST